MQRQQPEKNRRPTSGGKDRSPTSRGTSATGAKTIETIEVRHYVETIVPERDVHLPNEVLAETVLLVDVRDDASLRMGVEDQDFTTSYAREAEGFRKHHEASDKTGIDFHRSEAAYRYGFRLGTADNADRRSAGSKVRGRDWDAVEREARPSWERDNPRTWEHVKEKIRHAWEKVTSNG